ncbi:hypothetical protein SELMODRAFT_413093 [Selaginella moellendorffii]|uniref:ribonuclease H n=1 Tax=Selaginella moellendorffii TaxID=88036 RepID=D8RNB2_SELML|nr:hypothetical protein SELMODRAFT_413093 [Selaginella moellendorffii]
MKKRPKELQIEATVAVKVKLGPKKKKMTKNKQKKEGSASGSQLHAVVTKAAKKEKRMTSTNAKKGAIPKAADAAQDPSAMTKHAPASLATAKPSSPIAGRVKNSRKRKLPESFLAMNSPNTKRLDAFLAFVRDNKDTPQHFPPAGVPHAHVNEALTPPGEETIHPPPDDQQARPVFTICTHEHGKEDIEATWPWNVFTDGSLIVPEGGEAVKAGYGVYYVWCNGGCGLAKHVQGNSRISYDAWAMDGSRKIRIIELALGGDESALTMELLAILEALLLVQSFWGYSRLYLYTDSMAALKLLAEFQKRPGSFARHVHGEVLAAITSVARSSYIEHVHLLKVRAHAGLFGNEAADRLAKIGANLPVGSSCKFNLSNVAQPGALAMDPGLVCTAEQQPPLVPHLASLKPSVCIY